MSSNSEVFLGFVDAPIDVEEEEPTIEDTFIGGKPIWLNPNSPPDKSLITCDNCQKEMALLLQAFSPIDGKLYDRVIYIFGCKNTKECSKKKGAIKCIRAISKDPERVAAIKKELDEAINADLDEKLQLENKKKLNAELTKDLFSAATSSNNPFDTNPFGTSIDTNPFAGNTNTTSNATKSEQKLLETFASVASKNAPKKNKKVKQPASNLKLPEYPGFFLYVEKEKFKKMPMEPELEKYKDLIAKMDDESTNEDEDIGLSSSSSAQLNPQASQMASMLDDKYFEAFTNTVKHNPAQVLRYELNGKPLLYSGRDEIASKFSSKNHQDFNVAPPAYNPSTHRRFELQLMPKAIMDLENLQDNDVTLTDILNGMSWGTIIVCTDEEDYIPDEMFDDNHVGYISEWVGVQWEQLV
ncbi:uncharacterized protein KQ657_000059 [Scheffersomyces spartinae]|uniref:Programmed cell death protein 2 C-terminal domain-containing protein n=1 Tax=Scheffersomyces spartinae TaxID=45513 RepID=A0A9P8AK31_9ASCO|nr:uncharacterized protein KQ657_000059 [Scheffersomyces spartinae]KAG7196050.1 hypothetical protein KQ657_000059 [Scheffersomyces spartinae]